MANVEMSNWVASVPISATTLLGSQPARAQHHLTFHQIHLAFGYVGWCIPNRMIIEPHVA